MENKKTKLTISGKPKKSYKDFETNVQIIDPKDKKESKRRKIYSNIFWEDQKRRGYTKYDAKKLMKERNYFASMMI